MSSTPISDKELVAAAIVLSIREGHSLRKSARDNGIAPSTFLDWCDQDAILGEHYARARRIGSDILFDELQEEADSAEAAVQACTDNPKLANALVAAKRLRVDAIKWRISKQQPLKYGDKVDVTSAGEKIEGSQVWQFGDKKVEFK